MYTGDFQTPENEFLELWYVADQFGVLNALKAIPLLLDLADIDLRTLRKHKC